MKRKQVAMLIAGAAIVGAAGIGTGIYLSQGNDKEVQEEIETIANIEEVQEEVEEVATEPEVEQDDTNDEDYLVLMRTHLVDTNGTYSMDEESAEIIMDLALAKEATESEVNWWLNQKGDYGLWADAVYGTADEQTDSLAQQRMWLLEDLGDVDYRIHDEYVKAHQSNGSSSSSTQKPSNGSNNSSNNSSNGNGGSSSSNGGNSSSTPTPAPTPAPSGNSSSDSDYNPEFDDGAPNEQGTGNGGSSGNDFGGCITWR